MNRISYNNRHNGVILSTLATLPANTQSDETGKRHVLLDMVDVVDELASYDERMTDGTWVPSRGEDALIQVLKEHGRCTMGVGTHVGFTKSIPGYTPKLRKNRKKKK